MMRMIQVVFAVTLVVLVVFWGVIAETTHGDESLSTLKQIDCVVKKLNWMINVTEDLLLRARVHAEKVYKKKYLLEERYAAWERLFVYVKPFMKKQKGDKMKEILNEMERIVETESYLQKNFNLNVSYFEKKMMTIVRVGIRYSATMEEMYRVGLEAVRSGKEVPKSCEIYEANVTCERAFSGGNLSIIVAEFGSGTEENIDLRFENGGHWSKGGNKLADRVHNVSTTFGRVIKHRGIGNSLGKARVLMDERDLVEHVSAAKLLKLFVTHLREVGNLTSEVEATPSKLSERVHKFSILEKKLESLFNSL
ncbi:hypothetical protein, conserved [Trypanosoma brucei brucei TREU927]|uniref:Uncharacterized protein n=1 Tax=Trypanosoma brucei brucei (strain 927/4 GUTat10.1) TaxID=185431 RepID=Q584A3_TRYB2|nr:hypothetical protein, conserved [Trypanosoma brucei brucei TREU927]AAX79814.1 hypothetical protein, conserved [Trypanosoma brucei]AAZ10917.1 hypothetical protein, conserved [Trypanosoma brucei brucei TREU927]